ncbi:G-protein coupled receptor GRL101-like isoform X1 [Ptychodera flava]|uniref:G-protein coupled receptor GRL101-like isoform X1 n=1 Tax=Ptychodera flava TaxID=63121 RepID=UPI003969CE83
MDASDWTVGLMDCDEEIALEMCMTWASMTTHTCGVEAFECAGNECIHSVYVCDGNTDCINGSDEIGCNMAVACPTNSFQCENGKCVSMTFYCDFIDNCGDNSDEENCVYPNCTVDQFKCDNNQCVDKSKHCDLMEDCYDGSDEKYCDVCKGFQCYYVDCIPEHAQCDGELDCGGNEREDETDCHYGGTVSSSSEDVEMPIQSCSVEEFRCHNGPCVDRKWMCIYDFDQYGYQRGCRDVTHLRNCELFNCRDDMFKCPDAYCIPLHRRCDGIFDCPRGSDEENCGDYQCQGHYRCHGEKNCIPVSQKCDGVKQCWHGDDELLCGLICPFDCTCYGSVIDCAYQSMSSFPLFNGQDIKKLNMTGNDVDVTQVDFRYFQLLGELDLSNNSIIKIRPRQFEFLKNLYLLNLGANKIRTIEANTFYGLQNLRMLILTGNNIVFINYGAFTGLYNLHTLHLTGNLFQAESSELFIPLTGLAELYTDAYKYCCMVRKRQEVQVCSPPADAFSSCEDLMANQVLRWSIWLLGIAAFFGNLFVIVWRIKRRTWEKFTPSSFGTWL